MCILLFTEKRLDVAEQSEDIIVSCLTTIEFILFTLHSAVRMYSIKLSVSVDVEEEKGGRCGHIWLGRDYTPILVSSFVDRYRTSCAECDYIDFLAHLVSLIDNQTILSPNKSLLQKGVVVTAVILVVRMNQSKMEII